MSQSRPSQPSDADAAIVGHIRVVEAGERLVLENRCGGCFLLFLTLTVTFGGIPLVLFLIALVNNTLFEPIVLKALLILGIPAGLAIWYLAADTFNRQMITCDRHTLHRYDEPIWFFNSPINIPVDDIKALGIDAITVSSAQGMTHIHYGLYARLQNGRCIRVSKRSTNRDEMEFVRNQLQAYVPATLE